MTITKTSLLQIFNRSAIRILGVVICVLCIMNMHDAMAYCTTSPTGGGVCYNPINKRPDGCETSYCQIWQQGDGSQRTIEVYSCNECKYQDGYGRYQLYDKSDSELYQNIYQTCWDGDWQYNIYICVKCTERGEGPNENSPNHECAPCPVGKYSGSGDYTCMSCGPGQYQDQTGQDSCKSCNAGTYAKNGASTCSQCGANTYSGSGASSCTPCPANATCCNGAPGCGTFTCNSGYRKEGSICVEDGPKCDPVNEWNNNGTCTACPTYADCNGETFTCWNTFTNTGTQCVCNADQWVSNNQCTACPTYADCNGETFTCWNSFTKTNTACECGDRNWINTENCSPRAQCVSCPTDHVKQCGGTTLTCTDNYRIQFDDNSCTATCIWNDCPDGSWGDEKGCHPCPTDTASFVKCSGNTLTCAPGYYYNNETCTSCGTVPTVFTEKVIANQSSSKYAKYTSAAGATSITDCYLAPGKYYDISGTVQVNSNCPYKTSR